MSSSIQHKTVLILGWEYPPRMVGGLAIATYGLVEALRKHLNVILILPFKDEETPELDNVTVYGLNEIQDHFPTEEIRLLFSRRYETISKNNLHYYPNLTEEKQNALLAIDNAEYHTRSYSFYDAFQSDEVYGWSLWEKLDAYVEVVSIVAKYLEFDVIHCHDWLTYRTGIELKNIFGKPLVIHVHALETDRVGPQAKNEIYQLEKSAIIHADVVMPVSNFTKRQIVKYYVNYPDNIVPIHNAVSKEDVQRWKHKIPQKIVTFLGRITAQKGPEYLLDTVRKVVANYTEVRFVVAGSGDMLASLVNSTAYKGLSRYIIFAGFLKRDEVNALLSTTDVYFMPSVSEPFGLTALEAAHFQVPCVLTKQSGASEVLSAALTADYWDTDLFAQHITHLLQNEDKCKEIIEQSNEDLKNISWGHSANRVAHEYAKVISKTEK